MVVSFYLTEEEKIIYEKMKVLTNILAEEEKVIYEKMWDLTNINPLEN